MPHSKPFKVKDSFTNKFSLPSKVLPKINISSPLWVVGVCILGPALLEGQPPSVIRTGPESPKPRTPGGVSVHQYGWGLVLCLSLKSAWHSRHQGKGETPLCKCCSFLV